MIKRYIWRFAPHLEDGDEDAVMVGSKKLRLSLYEVTVEVIKVEC